MIGLNAHLCILVKMPEGGIQEGIITAVFLAQIFGKGLVGAVMFVNMHMVFLSAGYILPNIEHGCAKMGLIVHAECASLLTHLRNYALSLSPLGLLSHHQGHHHLWTCRLS
jgi:hypothetical protein